MRKTQRWPGFSAVWGLGIIFSGCRGSHDREGVNTPSAAGPPATAENQPAAEPARSGDLIRDEPTNMAREDQERADQAMDAQTTKKRLKRPEPPLRPVTR